MRRYLARSVASAVLLALGLAASGCCPFQTPTASVYLFEHLRLTYAQKVGGTTVTGAPLKVRVVKVGYGTGGFADRVTVEWERKPKAMVRKAGGGERRPVLSGRRTIIGLADSHSLGPNLVAQEQIKTPLTTFWLSRDVLSELKEDGESTLTFEGQLHRVVVKQEQYMYTAVVNGRTSNIKAMWIVTRETNPAKEADIIVLSDEHNPLVLKFDPRPYSLSGWELTAAEYPLPL